MHALKNSRFICVTCSSWLCKENVSNCTAPTPLLFCWSWLRTWKEFSWKMSVKGNISETQTEEKTMKGIREEEKVQKTPCTGLLGIFSSLFLKLFYFVLVVQCKQFKCQKLKTKPGPWHGGAVFSTSNRRSWMANLVLCSCSHRDHPRDLAWRLCCWATGGWEELGWGVFLSLKRAQKRHCCLLRPVWRGWIPVMPFGKVIIES